MSDTKKTREIDLFDLFSSIGNGIKNLFIGLFDALMWCFFFAVKKYKILLIFFALGLSYGIYKVSTGENYFSSNMLIRSNAISSFELKEKLDEFNNYFNQSNEFSNEILRNELNMDSVELSNVLGITSYYGIDLNENDIIDYYDTDESHNAADTINIRNDKYLLVKVDINNPQVLQKFQKGLLRHLNELPLLTRINNQRLANVGALIESYDLEMLYLDSLQRTTYFEENKASITMERNQIMLGESKKNLVHGYKFNISERKEEIINEYTVFTEPITVINDFSLAVKQESSSIVTILKDIIIFLFMGYLVIVGWYFITRISDKYLSKID